MSQELEALLYQALAEPIGLVCQAEPSFELGRQRLYAARKRIADPDLDGLQLRASPFPEGNLLIIRETIKIERSTSHE